MPAVDRLVRQRYDEMRRKFFRVEACPEAGLVISTRSVNGLRDVVVTVSDENALAYRVAERHYDPKRLTCPDPKRVVIAREGSFLDVTDMVFSWTLGRDHYGPDERTLTAVKHH